MSTQTCSRCKKNKTLDHFDGRKVCNPCREYARKNWKRWYKKKPRKRLPKKVPTRRTPSIVMGRRFCSKCRRWRLLIDFGVATYWDPITREKPRYWRTQCYTCERVHGRVKNARLAGRDRPYEARQAKMVGQKRNRHWYAKHKERMKDPEYAAHYREYQRIWAEGKRREQGIAPRQAMYDNRKVKDETPLVDAQPFVDWFNSLNGTSPTNETMGESLARRVYAVRSGEQGQIHLSIVDEVGHLVGEIGLTHILYPDD